MSWLDEALNGARGDGCPKCLVGRRDMLADPAFNCELCAGTGIPHFMLIAAAPDLLAVLTELVALTNGQHAGHRFTWTVEDPLMKRARAAIAKAEGR